MQTVDWRPYFPDIPGGGFGDGYDGGDVKYDEFRVAFYALTVLGWSSIPLSIFSWFVVFVNLPTIRMRLKYQL